MAGGLFDPAQFVGSLSHTPSAAGPMAMSPPPTPAANPFGQHGIIPFMAGMGFTTFSDHIRKLSNLANPAKQASTAPGSPGVPPGAAPKQPASAIQSVNANQATAPSPAGHPAMGMIGNIMKMFGGAPAAAPAVAGAAPAAAASSGAMPGIMALLGL